MKTATLRNGIEMPLPGFGVLQMRDSEECRSCVLEALKAGYRMFDTAAAYGNEEAVGEALKQAIEEKTVRREELFVITKLWIQDAREEDAERAFEASLEKLGLEYIGLYLIHQPYNDYYGAWRVLERLYREGKVRAIGVSNFSPERLTDLCLNSEIAPMVNQIELHPFYHQEEALRWNVDRQVSVVTRSRCPAHMREDFAIWDFKLSGADKNAIGRLDLGTAKSWITKIPISRGCLSRKKSGDGNGLIFCSFCVKVN